MFIFYNNLEINSFNVMNKTSLFRIYISKILTNAYHNEKRCFYILERTISVEDRIKRAEEIYNRRKNIGKMQSIKVNMEDRPDFSLFKRTIIKISLCVILYLVIYFIKNSNYFFSNDVINKTNEILSYDINLYKMYCDCSETVEDLYNNLFNIKKENIEVPQNEQLNSKSNEIEVKSIESEEDYEKQNKKENKDENIKEGTE